MKKFSIIHVYLLLCLPLFSQVANQQKYYVNLSKQQINTFTLAIDSILESYFKLSDFKNEDGEFDLKRKKKLKALFDDKAYVIDDLNLTNQKILLDDYTNTVSIKLAKIKEPLVQFPYKRQILADSVLYDKLDDKYEIPVKLNKILYYSINENSEVVKNKRSLNTLMYFNVYANSNEVKIVAIKEYTGTKTWLDCNDKPNGTAYIFSPCNDGDETTINDTFQVNCACIGFDCVGKLGGISKIGTPCDDADDNTINDVYLSSCECKGTIKCEENTPCDDDNKFTVNDLYQADCSCLGVCIEKGDTIKIGTLCDDDNLNTINDVYRENCVCLGTDCTGEVGGTKIAGTPCNDKNGETKNDVYNENCECEGINCKKIVGKPCNDKNDKTVNDVYIEACVCKGKPGCIIDGKTIVIGTPCNDGKDNTKNDTYQKDCECKGEPYRSPKVYAGIGGLFSLPSGSINLDAVELSSLKFNQANSAGGKLNVLFNPFENSKLFINAGLAFLPIKIETSGAYRLQFDNNDVGVNLLPEYFDDPISKLFVNLNEFKESQKSSYLQIPLGISYQLLQIKKVKVLVDVLAKPHFAIGSQSYQLNADVTYAGLSNEYGKPLILKNENFYIENELESEPVNNLHELMAENGYADIFALSRNEVAESLKTTAPFALTGGLNFLIDINTSKTSTSMVGLYVHYNYYLKSAGWGNVEQKEELSDFENFLIEGNQKSGNEFNILTNSDNFKSTISSSIVNKNIRQGLEAGISYYIKIK